MNYSILIPSGGPQLTDQARIDLLRGVSGIMWRLSAALSESDMDSWHFVEEEEQPGIVRIIFHRGGKYETSIHWLNPVVSESFLDSVSDSLLAEWNKRKRN